MKKCFYNLGPRLNLPLLQPWSLIKLHVKSEIYGCSGLREYGGTENVRLYHTLLKQVRQKDAGGMTNSEDPDQTAP